VTDPEITAALDRSRRLGSLSLTFAVISLVFGLLTLVLALLQGCQ